MITAAAAVGKKNMSQDEVMSNTEAIRSIALLKVELKTSVCQLVKKKH